MAVPFLERNWPQLRPEHFLQCTFYFQQIVFRFIFIVFSLEEVYFFLIEFGHNGFVWSGMVLYRLELFGP